MTAACAMLVACGRIGFDPGSHPPGDAGPSDAAAPAGCPAAPMPDVSSPDHVVGTGTPASCDEAALRNAIAAGGVIAFSCGSTPATIALAAELAIGNDTVLAGNGLITLDGNSTTRILHVGVPGAALTLVGMTLANGATTTSGGGVLVDAGSLTVIDSVLHDNHGPMASPSDGGGAIAAAVGATVAIYGSTLSTNQSANGGAVLMFSNLTIIDSRLDTNAATGTGGATDQGGLGGAITSAGIADNTFCGVTMEGNSAGAIGGAYHRVSIDGTGTDTFDRSSLITNHATTSAGGAYIQDVAVQLHQVTIANNEGGEVGGLWFQGAAEFDAENVTIADNQAINGLGAGLLLGSGPGTISFSTIAGNQANCPTCWSAAIDGGSMVQLRASLISDNTAGASFVAVSCRVALIDGGANFQWPVLRPDGGSDDPTSLCAAGATVTDPSLGALAPGTGPAGSYLVQTPTATSPARTIATGCPAQDQLGTPRPSPCTAGAIE